MTEQQIKQLKALMDDCEVIENSPELDQKIRIAARTKIARSSSFKLRGWFQAPLQWAAMGAMSVLFTTMFFLAMNKVLEVDEAALMVDQTITGDVAQPSQNVLAREQKLASSAPKLIEKPNTEFQSRQIINKDDVLAQLQLPDLETLLNTMQLDYPSDRLLAENTLSSALQEINSMLSQGQLDDARERYARLRDSCGICTLPTTLEALVRVGQRSASST